MQVTADEIEQRRLARAIGAENAQRLACGDRQRDAIGHFQRAKAFDYVLEGKYCRHSHSPTLTFPLSPTLSRGGRGSSESKTCAAVSPAAVESSATQEEPSSTCLCI